MSYITVWNGSKYTRVLGDSSGRLLTNTMSTPTSVLVTVPSGVTISASASLNNSIPVAVIVPTSTACSGLTFNGSIDGTNFYDVYKTDGTIASAAITSGTMVGLSTISPFLNGIQYFKIKVDASGAAASQYTIITRPVI